MSHEKESMFSNDHKTKEEDFVLDSFSLSTLRHKRNEKSTPASSINTIASTQTQGQTQISQGQLRRQMMTTLSPQKNNLIHELDSTDDPTQSSDRNKKGLAKLLVPRPYELKPIEDANESMEPKSASLLPSPAKTAGSRGSKWLDVQGKDKCKGIL